MNASTGRRLADRYRLGEVVGGRHGVETRPGFDLVLSRHVAVTVLDLALEDPRDRTRLGAAMRVVAGLDHRRLVTLLDAGVDETADPPRLWLVQEVVAGRDLADRLSDGSLDPAEVARVGAGLAAALAHLHLRDVVHGTLAPADVLLTEAGEVKLAGTAVATLLREGSRRPAPRPEEDVRGLGLLLLESLTGTPSSSSTAEDAASWPARGPLVPVSLGPAWTRLLHDLTDVDPARRPTATQAAARLDALRDTLPRDPSPPDAVRVLPTTTGPTAYVAQEIVVAPHHRRRRTTVVAAVVAAWVVLVLGVVGIAAGRGAAPPADAETPDPVPTSAPVATR